MNPRSWLRHLPLAWPLAKRDVMARYRGSTLGLLWALAVPLAMVAVYALVFIGVFEARWNTGSAAAPATGGGLDYALRLFAGLMAFSAVAEVATRATRLMNDNANLVKRVVFPLELLAVGLLMQVAVHLALQSVVLAALLVATGQGPRLSWALLPLAWVWILALQLLLALVLASLGCYVRDLQHLVPVLMTGLMFLTPIFYPTERAPAVLATVLAFNPLTAPIELLRAAWFGDALPAALAGAQLGLLVAALPLAAWLFARLRPGFADLV
jgi:lipopolysaccharide transport system permease protein